MLDQGVVRLAHQWRYHQVPSYGLIDHKRYAQKGSPIPDTPIKGLAWQIQAQAEGGFRFLDDSLFFVSSLLVKKPCRIQGLLMVMTLARLVYSVAPRRLRWELARQSETIPNPTNQSTGRPTLRGVFQVLERSERVRLLIG